MRWEGARASGEGAGGSCCRCQRRSRVPQSTACRRTSRAEGGAWMGGPGRPRGDMAPNVGDCDLAALFPALWCGSSHRPARPPLTGRRRMRGQGVPLPNAAVDPCAASTSCRASSVAPWVGLLASEDAPLAVDADTGTVVEVLWTTCGCAGTVGVRYTAGCRWPRRCCCCRMGAMDPLWAAGWGSC